MSLTKLQSQSVDTNITVAGVVTATSANVGSGITLSGTQINVGSATTIHSTGFRIGSSDLHSTGLSVQNVNASGVITATSASFSGNVSIAGTLTYEDVTNVDSIGLVTARSGVQVTGGNLLVGTSSSTGTASQPLQVTGGAYVSGNVGFGTINPIRQLHILGNVVSSELIIEKVGSKPDFSKWNFVVAGGSSTTASNLGLRLLNDAGTATTKLYWNVDGANNTQSFYDTVLVGSATSTGTASQTLQVTGGAYVSGSVGVGTTNPTRKLHLRAASADGLYLDSSDQTGNSGSPVVRVRGQRVDGNATQSFAGTLVLEKYRMDDAINSTQNLGNIIFGGNFSTTPGITTGMTYGASISGVAEGTFSSIATAPTAIVFNTGTVGLGTLGLPNLTYGTEAARITSNRNLLIGSTSATGTASQRLQVTGGAYVSGSVGIGTAVPGSKLDVSGNIAIGNVSGDVEGGQISIRDSSGTAYGLNIDIDGSNNSRIFNIGNSNLSIGNITGGSGSVKLYTNASERFSIDSSGRITMPSQVYVYAASGTRSGTANPVSPPHYPYISYSEGYDIGSNFNASTGVFTAPITGKYLIMGTWSQNATTGRAIGTLSFNGNYEEWVESNDAYNDVTGSKIRVLAANDTVSFGSQQAALSSIIISIWLLG